MSMLAERKRKQKYCLNPRGNDWMRDSNKFGQKMLEKMGWQPGKGLGAKEDGITEHIRISYNNNSKGFGYKDQQNEHETNFSALLESLSSEKLGEVKLNSLINEELKETKKDEENVAVIEDSKENGIAFKNLEEISAVLPIEKSPYKVQAKKLKKKKKQRELNDSTTKNKNKTVAVENTAFEDVHIEETIDLSQIEDNPYEVKVKKSKKKLEETVECSNSKESIEDSTKISQNEENSYKVKIKQKKKKKNEDFAMDNQNFDKSSQETVENISQSEENCNKVKIKQKKVKKNEDFAMENHNFDESLQETVENISQSEENSNEVKIKQKKVKKNEDFVMENQNFNESLQETVENPYEDKPKKKKRKKQECNLENTNSNESLEETMVEIETKPKKKKKKSVDSLAIDNLNFDLYSSSKEQSDKHKVDNVLQIPDSNENIEESNLILNIVATPITKNSKRVNDEIYSVTQAKRRKSVRFSDVTQERIIPSNEELRDIENKKELFEINTQVITQGLKEQSIGFDMSSLDNFSYGSRKVTKLGVNNVVFDKRKTNLEGNRYQTEIENDINKKKLGSLTVKDIMIGEVGNPHGEHEKLPEGTKLKFKYANFVSKTPSYDLNKMGPKKSYKHLIKGDIVVAFKNTNLHEIRGYAVKAQLV